MPEAWPADGAAGVCPDCDKSVRYTGGGPGAYGIWIHDSGAEDCDA